MKSFLIIITLISVAGKNISAQNLIINPSTEIYKDSFNKFSGYTKMLNYDASCGKVVNIDGWMDFNTCSNHFFVNDLNNNRAPSIFVDRTFPHFFTKYTLPKDGVSYLRLYFKYAYKYAFKQNNKYIKEYSYDEDFIPGIQGAFSKPLVAGKQYCFSVYSRPHVEPMDTQLNITERRNYFVCEGWAVQILKDSIGLKDGHHRRQLDKIKPDFYLKDISKELDTSKWTLHKHIYTAKGGERYFALAYVGDIDSVNLTRIHPKLLPHLLVDTTVVLDFDVFSMEEVNIHNPTNDTLVCPNAVFSKKLTALAGSQNGYRWSTGENTESILVNKPGKYWYVADYGCGDVADTITINTMADTIGDFLLPKTITICATDFPITLMANGMYKNYTWSSGQNTPTALINNAGKYYLTINNGCNSYTDSVIIATYPELRQLEIDTLQIFCKNTVPNNVFPMSDTLLWYAQNDVIGSNTPPTIPNEVGEYLYYTSTFKNGCESDKKKIEVLVLNNVVDNYFQNIDSFLCKDELLTFNFIEPYTKYYINDKLLIEKIYTISSTGVYNLRIESKCITKLESLNIRHVETCEACVKFPTAFTPNADGLNDNYKLSLQCNISDFQLKIFDRWGGVIVETTNPNFEWNGTTKNNTLAMDGIYIIHAIVNGKNYYSNVLLTR